MADTENVDGFDDRNGTLSAYQSAVDHRQPVMPQNTLSLGTTTTVPVLAVKLSETTSLAKALLLNDSGNSLRTHTLSKKEKECTLSVT